MKLRPKPLSNYIYQHIRSGQSPSDLALNQNPALINRPYWSNSEHGNVSAEYKTPRGEQETNCYFWRGWITDKRNVNEGN